MKTHVLSVLLVVLVAFGCGKRTPKQTAATLPPALPASAAQPVETSSAVTPPVEELTTAGIMDSAVAAYAALTSYSASGKTVSIIDMSGMSLPDMPKPPGGTTDSGKGLKALAQATPQTVMHDFTIALARPGSYRIEWEQKTGPVTQRGAVWSDGTDNYLMMKPEQYSKVQGRDMALAAATGISGGAANTVPSAFFGTGTNILKTLQDLSRRPDERVSDEDCYVIEGTLAGTMTMVYWIGKRDFLIRQRQQVLGGTMKMPEMSDDGIRQSLKSMNQEPTPEAIEKTRNTMKRVAAMTSKIRGTITETHTDIEVNTPAKGTAVAFKPPAEAKLVDSPFQGMFGGGKSPVPSEK